MSYWNSKKQTIVSFAPVICKEYPDWIEVDCGCCAGIKWGGEEPVECDRCNATGIIYVHIKSGVMADYPGGHFQGKYFGEDLRKLIIELRGK